MIKRFIFLIGMGVCHGGCMLFPQERMVVNMVSENRIVVGNSIIDRSLEDLINESKIMELLQSELGWQIGDRHRREVLLKVNRDVRYGCFWAVVQALNCTGCDVRIVLPEALIEVESMVMMLFPEDYLFIMDDHEIRAWTRPLTPFEFEDVSVAEAARRALVKQEGDMFGYMSIECNLWTVTGKFLDVLSVAREKGYARIHLSFPLGVSVKEAVREFMEGE